MHISEEDPSRLLTLRMKKEICEDASFPKRKEKKKFLETSADQIRLISVQNWPRGDLSIPSCRLCSNLL